jgi:hypothetical protein
MCVFEFVFVLCVCACVPVRACLCAFACVGHCNVWPLFYWQTTGMRINLLTHMWKEDNVSVIHYFQ